MKQLHFKRGVQRIIEFIVMLAVTFVLTTIESEWTWTYLGAVAFCLLIIFVGGCLLATYGKYEDDEDEWLD